MFSEKNVRNTLINGKLELLWFFGNWASDLRPRTERAPSETRRSAGWYQVENELIPEDKGSFWSKTAVKKQIDLFTLSHINSDIFLNLRVILRELEYLTIREGWIKICLIFIGINLTSLKSDYSIS